MLDESPNEGIILQFDRQNEKLEKKAKFAHKYAPTKIMWIPDTVIFYFYLNQNFLFILRMVPILTYLPLVENICEYLKWMMRREQ